MTSTRLLAWPSTCPGSLHGDRVRRRRCLAVAHPVRVHDLLPHCLPRVLDRPVGLHRDAGGTVAGDRQAALPSAPALLGQDLSPVLPPGGGGGEPPWGPAGGPPGGPRPEHPQHAPPPLRVPRAPGALSR